MNLLGYSLNANCQILSHESSFNSFNACIFQRVGIACKSIIVIELGTMGQATGPGKD